MTLILVAAALTCLSIPVALYAALFANDREARRADLGNEMR